MRDGRDICLDNVRAIEHHANTGLGGQSRAAMDACSFPPLNRAWTRDASITQVDMPIAGREIPHGRQSFRVESL